MTVGRRARVDRWSQAVEVPRADLPDANRQHRRAKVLRVAVWSILGLAGLNAFMGLSQLATAAQTTGETAVTAAEGGRARAVATLAVRDWLEQDPSPLPGGFLLTWDTVTTLAWPAGRETDVGPAPYDVEVHTFTLATPSGSRFTATVQVAADDAHGLQVVAGPSLVPLAPDDPAEWASDTPWPGSAPVPVPPDVEAAVGVWAAAFISDDPAALRLAVGDPQPGRSYTPLSGPALTGVRVNAAAASAGEPATTGAPAPATVIAQVTLTLDWQPGTPDAGGPVGAEATYDVLVRRADTASPAVTAWGGPGQGPTLVDFGNAVTGREITPAPIPTSVPATSGAIPGEEG